LIIIQIFPSFPNIFKASKGNIRVHLSAVSAPERNGVAPQGRITQAAAAKSSRKKIPRRSVFLPRPIPPSHAQRLL